LKNIEHLGIFKGDVVAFDPGSNEAPRKSHGSSLQMGGIFSFISWISGRI
jgi:hypothetical protein